MTYVSKPKLRIEVQELLPHGVWTTYSDGTEELLPYSIDENGSEYVELDPNKNVGDPAGKEWLP